jgi:ribosome maturation factor RimP
VFERFKGKKVSVALKFPIPSPDGFGFPQMQGKLVDCDAEGLLLDVNGQERIIPHGSVQHVEPVSEIERVGGGLVIPNVRG